MGGVELRKRVNTVTYKESTRKVSVKSRKVAVAAPKDLSTDKEQKSTKSSSPSLVKRTSINQPRTTTPAAIPVITIPPARRISNRANTSNQSTLPASAQRQSTLANSSTPTTVVKDKISALDARIKAIEQKESRANTYEATFNALVKENLELRQSITDLKAEFEGVQHLVLSLFELETQIGNFEDIRRQLAADNQELQSKVSELSSEADLLKSEVRALQSQQHQSKADLEPVESGISADQIKLNSNIVIRGVEIAEKSDESAPVKVFDSIRAHLGLQQDETFNPVGVRVFPIASNSSTNTRTIQVQFRSVEIKRKFLQVRRIKKQITPRDIGVVQGSNKAILITEQLTKQNQELLFAARSLRHSHKYKFVWSNNGEILVRPKPKSKVIRITSIDEVNKLRSEIQLQPLLFKNNGRLRSSHNHQPTESST